MFIAKRPVPFAMTLLTLWSLVVARGEVVYQHSFNNAAGWRMWPPQQQAVLAKTDSGASAFKLEAPAATAYYYWDLKPEMRYRLKAKIKVEAPGKARSRFHIKFNRKGAGNGSAGEQALPLPDAENGTDATDWREVEFEIDTAPDTAHGQFLMIAEKGETLWVESLKLVEERSIAVVIPPPSVLENSELRLYVSAAGGAIVKIEDKVHNRVLLDLSGSDGLANLKLAAPRRIVTQLHSLELDSADSPRSLVARYQPTSGHLQDAVLEKRISLAASGRKIALEMRFTTPTTGTEPWVFNFLPGGVKRQANHWLADGGSYRLHTKGGDIYFEAPKGRGLALIDKRGVGLLMLLAEPPTRFYSWKGMGETTLEWPMQREATAATPTWVSKWEMIPFDTAELETTDNLPEELLQPLAAAFAAAAAKRANENAIGPVATIPPVLTEYPTLPGKESAYLFTDRSEPQAYVFHNLPVPISFTCVNPEHKPVLVMELPATISFHGGIRGLKFEEPVELQRHGAPYKRHRITIANPAQMWQRLLWDSSAAPGTVERGYYWAEWGEGQRQAEQELAIEVLAVPEVKPPKKMPVYISLPSDMAEVWLKSGADPTRLGINLIDIWPYTRGNSASGMQSVRNILAMAQPLGLDISAWGGDWWFESAKKDPEAQTISLQGEASQFGCPTYRGKFYQELLDHGRLLVDLGVRRHVFDPEYYRSAPEKLCYCQRCCDEFAVWLQNKHSELPQSDPRRFMQADAPDTELRAAWLEFRAASYAGMFSGYRKAMEEHIAAKHPEDNAFWMLIMNAYHRGREAFYGFDDYRASPQYTESL